MIGPQSGKLSWKSRFRSKSFWRRFLVLMAILALGGWLASTAVVAKKFTQRRRPLSPTKTPKVSWGNIEDHRLKTSDGQEIGAWLVRGKPDKPCTLLLHGVLSSRRNMLRVMECLAEAGCTVMSITFRAHGDSTGEVVDFGWSNRLDVVAAVDFLRREYPKRPIYIVGRSMGAAAAIFAAKELQEIVAGYFLEQPYKDLNSAVWHRLHYHLPLALDQIAYWGLQIWSPVLLHVDPNVISPIDRIQDIPEDVPIVLVGGTADRHAPLDDVRAIFQKVQSHAKMVIFDGAVHEDLDKNNPALYRTSLLDFLNGREINGK
jgi:uncharacterized protein